VIDRPADAVQRLVWDGLVRDAARLVGVAVATLVVMAPVAYAVGRVEGLVAAALACLVCCGAGILGLVVSEQYARRNKAVAGVLAGMAVRISIVPAALLALWFSGMDLVETGLAFYLIAFYLITLAADTWLATAGRGTAGRVRGEER